MRKYSALLVLALLVCGLMGAQNTFAQAYRPPVNTKSNISDSDNLLEQKPVCKQAIDFMADDTHDPAETGRAVIFCGRQVMNRMRSDYTLRISIPVATLQSYLDFFGNAWSAYTLDQLQLTNDQAAILKGWDTDANNYAPYLAAGFTPTPVPSAPASQSE